RRMGKSLKNYVGISESAYDQFAKVMSIPDGLMREWFELLTDRSPEEISQLTDPQTTHPRQAKEVLGKDIVDFYHGAQAATEAAEDGGRRFSCGQDPTDIPARDIPAAELAEGKMWVCKLLTLLGLSKSNNEARRLVEGGGVTIGPERQKITDPKANIPVTDGL